MSVEKLEATKSGGWRAQALQLAAVVLAVFVAKGALAEPFTSRRDQWSRRF